MKKKKYPYEQADIQIITFASCDVITTSGEESQESSGALDSSWDVN